MLTWTNLITIIIVTVGLSGFFFFIRHFNKQPQDKRTLHDRETLYQLAKILAVTLAWAIIYKVTLDAYRIEFESLSTSKRQLIQIMFLIAPLGGVNGYRAHLIMKHTESRRVSSYIAKMAKAQKFRRWGKK